MTKERRRRAMPLRDMGTEAMLRLLAVVETRAEATGIIAELARRREGLRGRGDSAES